MGGPARHVILLDRGLQARGHRTLLAHGSLDEGEGSLEHLADVHGIPVARVPGLGRRVTLLGDVRAFLRILAMLFRERPDVVHTHTAKAGALGRLAALLFNATRGVSRRCVVVHTFHGHVLEGYFHPAVDRLVRGVERTLARVTDRIVTVSPRQRRDLVERFRIAEPSKTVAIPLGLDLSALLNLAPDAPNRRAGLGFAADDVVVGYVGRMVPIKDLPMLVNAFAQALRACPRLRLLLVGDGPLRGEIDALVSRLGMSGAVRFAGWTEDLPGVYATLDICALASRNEGTPVAVIEAMAAARAVVATAVGGVPDVVQDGVTGVLVPPGDAGAMAAALVRLGADGRERRRLGEAAARHAAARYSADRLVDDLERLYLAELLRKRGSRPAAGSSAVHEV
jgi:glycosyltransferase involved in cell wall biosynthesis